MHHPLEHRARVQARTLLAVLLALALVGVTPQVSEAAQPDKQPMNSFEDGQAITGTFSMLRRGGGAIASQIRTTGEPGHAVTIWYVIFNAPENCSDDACGEDDIFNFGDPTPEDPFNAAQIEAARISVVYGGDGDVVNPGGRVALDGGLAEGEVPTGTNQVVIGHPDDALVGLSPVTGLEDAMTAEVHIVLQDHGEAQEDPDLLASQLSGFNLACNPTCTDTQFAVHK